MDPEASTRLDYQLTVDVIKLLTDVRFRCLAFVTAVTALAGTILSTTSLPVLRVGVSLAGLVMIFGILIYELRNSQIYEAAIHRAKALEARLGVIRAGEFETSSGLFSERPDYLRKSAPAPNGQADASGDKSEGKAAPASQDLPLLGFRVKHDVGLALVYSGAIGGWVFLSLHSVMSLPVPDHLWPAASTAEILLAALSGALICTIALFKEIIRHDGQRYKPAPREKTELVRRTPMPGRFAYHRGQLNPRR